MLYGSHNLQFNDKFTHDSGGDCEVGKVKQIIIWTCMDAGILAHITHRCKLATHTHHIGSCGFHFSAGRTARTFAKLGGGEPIMLVLQLQRALLEEE